MSLVRLLAAGKSVVGLRNGASPYRVTGQRLLPKFGPDNSRLRLPKAGSNRVWPCATVKGTESGESPRCVKAGAGSGAEGGPSAPPRATVAAPSRRGHPSRVLGWLKGPARAGVAAPAPSGPRLGRAGRWLTRRFDGLFGRSGLEPERQAGASLDWSAIQGELRLEQVKVVRNDLSDTDLELVELRPRTAAARPKEAGLAKSGPSRLAGLRSLLGLFGANRT